MSAVYNRLNLEPGSALTNPIPNWLWLMRKDCGGSEVALCNKVRPHNGPLGAFVVRTLQICVLILAAIAMAAPLAAEDVNAPNPGAGRITGTVTDVDNDTVAGATVVLKGPVPGDRKSTRLNSSHQIISYAVFCLKKKKHTQRSSSDHHTDSHTH